MTNCDHPGIEHSTEPGPFDMTYCWPCPKCGICKFIGHGPLCIDCFATTAEEQQ